MHKVLPWLGLTLFAAGCAGVATLPISNILSSTPAAGSIEIHQSTDVRLDRGNFFVVKTNVVGQSRGFALLGIITMVPAQFNTAMNRLYLHAGMQPGKAQTLAGLAMEKNSSYWILFSIPRVTVRADVVEFTPSGKTNETAGSF